MQETVPADLREIPPPLFSAVWDLSYACFQAWVAAVDAQRSFLRPWSPAQDAWLSAWSSAWTWPGPASCFMRGTEQLA